jgi:hypothetical protein
MKKIIVSLAVLLITSLSLNAQRLDEEKREKIEKLKRAYILMELELDEKQEVDFTKIYQDYEAERKALRSEAFVRRKKMHSDFKDEEQLAEMSEEEALKALENRLEMEKRKLKMEEEFLNKMVESIGAKKVLAFKHAEMDFKKELLHLYKDDRRNHELREELMRKRERLEERP